MKKILIRLVLTVVLIVVVGCAALQNLGVNTANLLSSLRALQVAAQGCVIAASAMGALAEAAICQQAANALAAEIALVEAGNIDTAQTVIASYSAVLSQPVIEHVMRQQLIRQGLPLPPAQP